MDDLKWFLVDFLQAMAAGLLVGGTYGLMCVGPRHHLRRDARRELRAWRFHDARHVCGVLPGDGLRHARVPRAVCRPDRRRAARRPDRLRDRLAAAQVPDRTGHRRARHLGGSRRPLRADHPDARHRAGAGERRPDPVRLDADLGADAAVARVLGDRTDLPQPGAHRRLHHRGRLRDRALPVPDAHQPRQGAARRRRQSDRRGLRRRRRRPRAPHRVRPRRRHHRRSRAGCSRCRSRSSPTSASTSSS